MVLIPSPLEKFSGLRVYWPKYGRGYVVVFVFVFVFVFVLWR